jgi:hypothetical protein
MSPRLKAADREELSDAKLLLATCQGNVVAALTGEELEQSLRNAELQSAQVAAILQRIRERVLGT